MFISSEDVIKQKLSNFFNENDNFKIVYEIINNDNNFISKRFIEWFITKYSKDKNIKYKNGDKYFHVYEEYKNKLKGTNKKNFDPFCRKTKNYLIINFNKTEIKTTIGQLYFFKWCMENGIINFIKNNYSKIISEKK